MISKNHHSLVSSFHLMLLISAPIFLILSKYTIAFSFLPVTINVRVDTIEKIQVLSSEEHTLASRNRPSLLLYSSKDDNVEDAGIEDADDESTVLPSPTSCNVLGTTLTPCCTNVGGTGIGTGFYRNGYCSTGDDDTGRHTVCVQVTDEFLSFSKSVGNDLSTPRRRFMFPGLKDGDVWCLCAARYKQALDAGVAPRLYLTASHEKTLDYVSLETLKEYAIDREEAEEILKKLNEQRAKLENLLE